MKIGKKGNSDYFIQDAQGARTKYYTYDVLLRRCAWTRRDGAEVKRTRCNRCFDERKTLIHSSAGTLLAFTKFLVKVLWEKPLNKWTPTCQHEWTGAIHKEWIIFNDRMYKWKQYEMEGTMTKRNEIEWDEKKRNGINWEHYGMREPNSTFLRDPPSGSTFYNETDLSVKRPIF